MDEQELKPDGIMQLGLGILGLEDAAERGRARALHRACRERARRRGGAARAPRPCTRAARATSSTPSSRWGCWSATTAALRQHAGDRAVPRPAQAQLRRRHARDGERAAVRVLGPAHRRRCAPASRRTRPSSGGDFFEAAVCRSGAARELPQSDDRASASGAAPAMAAKFPWREYQTLRRCRRAAGRAAACSSRWRTRICSGGGFDLPAVRPHLRGVRRPRIGVADRLAFQPGDFFADQLPAGRRDRDGAHPARLEPRGEADADREGARGAARRRRARSSTRR